MVFPREALYPFTASRHPRLPRLPRLAQKILKRLCDGINVVRIERERDVSGYLAQRAVVRARARNAAVHRLDQRKPEAFEKTRKDIEACLAPESRHIRRVDESGEADEIGVRRLHCRFVDDFGVLPVRTRDHERMRLGHLPRQLAVGLD